MYYNDGPEMDENLRITKCPRCENEIFDEDAEFCQICGLSLYNKCVRAEIHDEEGNFVGYGQEHRNKGNARFCKICGAKTTYNVEGILKDYVTVLAEIRSISSENDKGFSSQIDDDDIPF